MTSFNHAEMAAKLRGCLDPSDRGTIPLFGRDEIRELLLMVDTLGDLRKAQEVRATMIRALRAQRDEAVAVRASAEEDIANLLREVRELKDAQQWVVARDGGRWCERCEGEVTCGQAYENLPGTGGHIQHVRCPNGGAS